MVDGTLVLGIDTAHSKDAMRPMQYRMRVLGMVTSTVVTVNGIVWRAKRQRPKK